MGARDGRSPLTLALAAGESQRMLVEAGSTLVVMGGALIVRFPYAWLAESVVMPAQRVGAEEAIRLEAGGWIDLAAESAAELAVLPPTGAGLWGRLAQLLAQAFGEARAVKTEM